VGQGCLDPALYPVVAREQGGPTRASSSPRSVTDTAWQPGDIALPRTLALKQICWHGGSWLLVVKSRGVQELTLRTSSVGSAWGRGRQDTESCLGMQSTHWMGGV